MGLKLIEGFKAFGVSVSGVQKQLRTDEVGRMKISHAQPPATLGTLAVVGDTVAVPMDSLSDVIFYFSGAAHSGFNNAFEQSPDSTNGIDGAWFPVLAKNQGAVATVSAATGVLTANGSTSFAVSAPGASYVRVRTTAATSGSLNVSASGSTAARPTDVTVAGAPTSVSVSGSGTSSIAKAEDAAHASGDLGVPTWGVRVPATPSATAPTSAAGDYGSMAITSEGKQVIAGQGAEEHTWQSFTNLAVTTDTAAKAAAGTGLRNYITDITLDNTGATAARVLIKDGANTVLSVTVPPNSSILATQKTPLRGTANTAINIALAAAGGTVSVALSGYTGI